MVRFGTKSLLLVFVLLALWLSTFSGYAAGRDVRASVLLVVMLAAGFAAIYRRGQQRAFWAGFFVVMLLCGGNLFQGPANKYVPQFAWPWRWLAPPATPLPMAPVTTTVTPSPPRYAPPAQTYFYSYSTVGPTGTIAAGAGNQEFAAAMHATIEAVWTLVLAVLVGFVGVWLFRGSQKSGTQAAA